MVTFMTLFKVVLSFESVDEILKYNYAYYAVQDSSMF